MKKLILLLTVLFLSASFAYSFEFNTKIDDKLLTCESYEDGFVCSNGETVYIEDFQIFFKPLLLIPQIFMTAYFHLNIKPVTA